MGARVDAGRRLVAFAPYFKMYRSLSPVHARDQGARRRPAAELEAEKFLQEQSALPQMESKSLQSLLIMPVQRIPRYKLLVEELLERTLKEHGDAHPDARC